MKFLDVEIRKRGGQPKPKPVKQYPEYVGKDLMELMLDFPGKTIHVGASCGFMFIGTPEEYFKTKTIRRLRRKKQSDPKYSKPHMINTDLGSRTIKECYDKVEPKEGIIVIIDGYEEGRFWFKSEYDIGKEEDYARHKALLLPFVDKIERKANEHLEATVRS